MNKSALVAIAAAATALAAAATALATEANENPNPVTPETPEPDKPETPVEHTTRRRGRPAAEKPAAETRAEEPAAPAGKTYEDLRELIRPLVEEGRGEEVKKVIAKYAPSLKEMDAKHHAAFEKDISALSY